MALAVKPKAPARQSIWRVPRSKASWQWLLLCLLLYGVIFVWYLSAIHTQSFAGPFAEPLRTFGIIAFVLVLATASYSLRRRFVRGLPGKAQDWLWMHTWIGITALLIAFLHENYAHICHDYCTDLSCFTQAEGGTSALFALLFLVVSGLVGRFLDRIQTRIIAQEANTNGVGICKAAEERLLELEYTIERLCAGKSEQFKQYATPVLEHQRQLSSTMPVISAGEQKDFQKLQETLGQYISLRQSLYRQKRAVHTIRIWRSVHMVLACAALIIILFHGGMELLTNVLHLLP